MSLAHTLVGRASLARRKVRFALWAAHYRFALDRAGCDLELIVPPGEEPLGELPVLTISRQAGHLESARRGRLRIELGENVHWGRVSTIEFLPSADSTLSLGDGVTVSTGVRLLLLGGEIRVGAYTRLRDGVNLKTSGGRLWIGRHILVQNGCFFACTEQIVLDDYAGVAERVSIIDSDHQPDGSDVHFLEQPIRTSPVHVGANAWLGANVVLLRGTNLGRNAVVAAGSVVRGGDYPPGWLLAGVPATPRRPLPNAPATDGTAPAAESG